jgi:hypothetical protein
MPRCNCEHISHFEHEVGTPRGLPAHLYNCAFLAEDIVTIQTAYGPQQVCTACALDCHAHSLDAALTRELVELFRHGLPSVVGTIAKGGTK